MTVVDFAKLLKNRRTDSAQDRAEEAADARQDAASYGDRVLGVEEEAWVPEPEGDANPEPTPATIPIPEVLDTDLNYISGPAGTGKTWLARAMVAQRPGTLLCATTGIAAVNLGEGTTINAALGYFDTASLKESWMGGQLVARMGKLYKAGIRRLLIDEVSMMDAEQLTIITKAAEELAGRGYTMNVELEDEIGESEGWVEGEDESRAFPLRITLVGDFAQLPPVKAPFAFESPEWGRFAPQTLKLTEVKRQADAEFIAAIHAARMGDADHVCEYFRPYLQEQTDHHFDGMTIVATNEAVERFNYLRVSALPSPLVDLPSARWGKQRGDWKNIPEVLKLKEGALVMLLANRRTQMVDGNPLTSRMIYANGDLAHVTGIDGKRVWVKLQRNEDVQEVEWVTRANTIPLEPGRAKALKLAGQEHLIGLDNAGRQRWEIAGEVRYLPLRIAYSSTVHKVQGLSMDAAQVNTREGFFKSPAMLYVALSRARTAEGLRLIGSVDGLRQRCTVDARVKGYL